MKSIAVKTTRTARCQVFSPENLQQEIKECWIVLHGYAQLASDFLHNFESFQKENRIIVAPEGLSRFYAKGFAGNPAASWMTSEDRENEIEDYCNYLDNVVQTIHAQYPLAQDCKFLLLGFSQGVATLSRWVNKKSPSFDTLVLYAGSIAPDLNCDLLVKQTGGKSLHFVSGDADPLISKADLAKALEFYENAGLKFETHFFKGKHEVKAEALAFLN